MRVGIDIGGMTVKIGLVKNEKVIAKKVIETDIGKQLPCELIEKIAKSVITLLDENDIKQESCEGMGIACPGTVDSQGGIVTYSNNLDWENEAILEQLQQYINIPMAIANDADAAALGEVVCGAAKGKNSAVLLTLGTGVGGGVIMDGKIFSGFLKGGCELGHIVIERDGSKCTCGRKGCLEMYASATALMRRAREMAIQNPQSLLCEMVRDELSDINGEIIFEASKRGDDTAKKVVERYIDDLSIGIANLINIFRPEIFILGGGVSAQKEYLTEELQDRVNKMCFGGAHGEIPLIVTSDLGNDAGIIGAAYLNYCPRPN